MSHESWICNRAYAFSIHQDGAPARDLALERIRTCIPASWTATSNQADTLTVKTLDDTKEEPTVTLYRKGVANLFGVRKHTRAVHIVARLVWAIREACLPRAQATPLRLNLVHSTNRLEEGYYIDFGKLERILKEEPRVADVRVFDWNSRRVVFTVDIPPGPIKLDSTNDNRLSPEAPDGRPHFSGTVDMDHSKSFTFLAFHQGRVNSMGRVINKKQHREVVQFAMSLAKRAKFRIPRSEPIPEPYRSRVDNVLTMLRQETAQTRMRRKRVREASAFQ